MVSVVCTVFFLIHFSMYNTESNYRGILPALGHDRVASESEILGALAVTGPQQRVHITHLFNVSNFHHRYTLISTLVMVFKLNFTV